MPTEPDMPSARPLPANYPTETAQFPSGEWDGPVSPWDLPDDAPFVPDYGRETTIGPTPGFPQNRRPEPRDPYAGRPAPRKPPPHGAQPTGLNDNNYWQGYFASRFGNLAPLPGYNSRNSEAARIDQQRVIQDLQRQAAGDMNSRAQQSLYAQNNAAQGQQRSLASTQRGVGAGAQMQQAQTGAAQVQAGLAGQQQQLYLREQQAAQQQLAQQLALMSGQDSRQVNDATQIQLQGRSLEDAMNQFMAGQGVEDALGTWQTDADRTRTILGLDLDAAAARDAMTAQYVNAGGTAAASLANVWQNNTKDGDSGYKQINGQNTIMPLYDK